ncbi:MAG: ribosome maturation factor RimM [Eubacteriales bacterium]
MEYLKLGQIVSVVGIKGELKVYPYTDNANRYDELKEIIIDDNIYKIEKVRYKNDNIVVLKLEGINDRNTSETFRGKYIFIDKKEAKTLSEGTYYIFDLIGIDVFDEDDKNLGKVLNVIQNKSQDLYEIQKADGNTFLLPAVEEFIINVDVKNRKMIVRLIEGLI